MGKLYVHITVIPLEDVKPSDLTFMCSSRDTSRYGMGSETPMHPSL